MDSVYDTVSGLRHITAISPVDAATNCLLPGEELVVPALPGARLTDDGGELTEVPVVSRLTPTPPAHPVRQGGVTPG